MLDVQHRKVGGKALVQVIRRCTEMKFGVEYSVHTRRVEDHRFDTSLLMPGSRRVTRVEITVI